MSHILSLVLLTHSVCTLVLLMLYTHWVCTCSFDRSLRVALIAASAVIRRHPFRHPAARINELSWMCGFILAGASAAIAMKGAGGSHRLGIFAHEIPSFSPWQHTGQTFAGDLQTARGAGASDLTSAQNQSLQTPLAQKPSSIIALRVVVFQTPSVCVSGSLTDLA